VAIAATVLVGLTGCDTVGQQAEAPAGAAHPEGSGPAVTRTGAISAATTSTTAAPDPEVTFSPPAGATNVRPDAPISVTVSGGRLTSLVIASSAGPVDGTFDAGNFAPAHALTFGQSYTVTATVAARGGALSSARTRAVSFTTLTQPTTAASVDISPEEGATVGAGMPVIVNFPSSVPDSARAAVARWFTVTSTPATEGGWRWISDTEMHWRPRYYWPARAEVTVNADLSGHAIAESWFTSSVVQRFKVGESHRITIDAATHQMVAYENGQALRDMPISTGRDAYPTASGTDLIMEKHDIFEMDSTSAGITGRDAYLVTVRNAQRLTNSGTFIHAAPWNGQLGSANLSHGCVNASNADAAWMMDFTLLGDPVEISNTAEQVQPYNGWGDWNIPFDQWANSG
jgi:lipoprotein-anchoring transpeptidase ErfK/SrfK